MMLAITATSFLGSSLIILLVILSPSGAFLALSPNTGRDGVRYLRVWRDRNHLIYSPYGLYGLNLMVFLFIFIFI